MKPQIASSTGDAPTIVKLLSLNDREDSLVGAIAESIGRAIIEGELPPGADLNSVELARRFDSSRTPVREALLLLEKEGLVEIPPRRRPRVAYIGLAEVRDIYHVRAHLHGMVFELLAARGSAEHLAAIRAAFEKMASAAAAKDFDGYFWANVAMHDLATECCGNAPLKRILDNLRLRTMRMRRLSLSQQGRVERSAADHARLIQACEDRDSMLAAMLMRSIVLTALAAIESSGWTGLSGDTDNPDVPDVS